MWVRLPPSAHKFRRVFTRSGALAQAGLPTHKIITGESLPCRIRELAEEAGLPCLPAGAAPIDFRESRWYFMKLRKRSFFFTNFQPKNEEGSMILDRRNRNLWELARSWEKEIESLKRKERPHPTQVDIVYKGRLLESISSSLSLFPGEFLIYEWRSVSHKQHFALFISLKKERPISSIIPSFLGGKKRTPSFRISVRFQRVIFGKRANISRSTTLVLDEYLASFSPSRKGRASEGKIFLGTQEVRKWAREKKQTRKIKGWMIFSKQQCLPVTIPTQ